MKRVLLDCALIFDLLQSDRLHLESAEAVVLDIARKKCAGVLLMSDVEKVYRAIRDRLGQERAAREYVRILFQLFSVESIRAEDGKRALSSMLPSFEAAIRVEVARRLQLDGIVTWQIGLYALSDIPILEPADFHARIQRQVRRQAELDAEAERQRSGRAKKKTGERE